MKKLYDAFIPFADGQVATEASRESTLVQLIVLSLPRLTGREFEHLWSKMDEVVERRREQNRLRHPESTGSPLGSAR